MERGFMLGVQKVAAIPPPPHPFFFFFLFFAFIPPDFRTEVSSRSFTGSHLSEMCFVKTSSLGGRGDTTSLLHRAAAQTRGIFHPLAGKQAAVYSQS